MSGQSVGHARMLVIDPSIPCETSGFLRKLGTPGNTIVLTGHLMQKLSELETRHPDGQTRFRIGTALQTISNAITLDPESDDDTVQLDTGGRLLLLRDEWKKSTLKGYPATDSNSVALRTALHLKALQQKFRVGQEKYEVVVITNNPTLQILGKQQKVRVEAYYRPEETFLTPEHVPTGRKRYSLNHDLDFKPDSRQPYEDGRMLLGSMRTRLPEEPDYVNQCLEICTPNHPADRPVLLIYKGGDRCWLLKRGHEWGNHYFDLVPKNDEHLFALGLAFDPDIVHTVFLGIPGGGKTHAAVGAALILSDGRFMVCRRNQEIGDTLGYLKGDLAQKMDPYSKPIHDIIHRMMNMPEDQRDWRKASKGVKPNGGNGGNGHKNGVPPDTAEKEKGFFYDVDILPPNYVLGSNIFGTLVVDEAQNLTPEETLALLTRTTGEGAKVIATGDFNQIHRPFMSFHSSGLTHHIRAMHGHPSFAVFQFKESVRHPIIRVLNDRW